MNCGSEHCITCGDDGDADAGGAGSGRPRAVRGPEGARHTVEIALVDAGPGDDVLVHAGVALVTL